MAVRSPIRPTTGRENRWVFGLEGDINYVGISDTVLINRALAPPLTGTWTHSESDKSSSARTGLPRPNWRRCHLGTASLPATGGLAVRERSIVERGNFQCDRGRLRRFERQLRGLDGQSVLAANGRFRRNGRSRRNICTSTWRQTSYTANCAVRRPLHLSAASAGRILSKLNCACMRTSLRSASTIISAIRLSRSDTEIY